MTTLYLVLFIAALGLLWTRKMRLSIGLLALEGALLSMMVWNSGYLSWTSALVTLSTLAIKAGLIPAVLSKMVRAAPTEARHDQSLPLWAYGAAVVVTLGTVHIISLLGPSHLIQDKVAFFYSLSTVYLGLVMIVARRHMLSQIAALVSIENGLVLLGVSLAGSLPTLVEFGILVDLVIAVTLLVWTGRRIHREFQTTDVVALQQLKG